MLSVKGGTQTWSKSTQQVDLGKDNTRSMSAQDQAEFFGDQPVGDVLNKVSDPNWVDPAKAVRKVGEGALDKDAFMKLLLTQMKNQDPTSPMQSHEMAAQLAQFTSLEKLTNINDGIAGLTKAQEPSRNFETLSLIGKAVAGDSAKIDRTDTTDSHTITFKIMQDAQKAKIVIKDAEGTPIREIEAANLKAGKNEIEWNGKTLEGKDANKGSYTAEIEARGSNGAKLAADTKFHGVISGVNFTAQGPILMIGKQSVSLKDIKEIVDPALAKQNEMQQMIQQLPPQVQQQLMGTGAAATQAPPTQQPAASAQTKTEDKNSNQYSGNLENVGMSRGMINTLKKEGAKTSI